MNEGSKHMEEMTLKSFDDLILSGMRDPEYATAYLQDALDDSMEDFLRALGKYVKANGGIAKCAIDPASNAVQLSLCKTSTPT